MNLKRSSDNRLFQLLAALLLLGAAGVLGAEAVVTPQDKVHVTCTPAFYQNEATGELVEADAAKLMASFRSHAIVLRVLGPEQMKGEVIRFHFDFPEPWDSWYKPGRVYEGTLSRQFIGAAGYYCDPGWFETTEGVVLTNRTIAELRQLLYERRWHEPFMDLLKKQLSDEQLFRVLYEVLTDADRSKSGPRDQQAAATYLLKWHVACPLSPAVAIKETLEIWQDGVGEWPWYLWRSFGREASLKTLAELERKDLSARARDNIETWRLWLGTKDLPPESVPWRHLIPLEK